MIHYRGGQASIDPGVYPDEEQFWADLSAAYAKQVHQITALGCRYLQLDDTSLAYLNDPNQRASSPARVGTLSTSTSATSSNQRGAERSSPRAHRHHPHVPGKLPLLVGGRRRLRLRRRGIVRRPGRGRFFLEYDDARSGDFSPLRFVPPGKRVVLGLVTTKRGALMRFLLDGRGQHPALRRAGRLARLDSPDRR